MNKIINVFKPHEPTDKDKELTSYLITKQLLLNSLAATVAYEVIEHTKRKDPRIYNEMRNQLNQLIKRADELHQRYMKIIPDDNMIFWKKLDELNKLIDDNLLSK